MRKVVRVVLSPEQSAISNFVFCLEYIFQLHRRDTTGSCFDILCPQEIADCDSEKWASGLAERLDSEGLNAVSAPIYPR